MNLRITTAWYIKSELNHFDTELVSHEVNESIKFIESNWAAIIQNSMDTIKARLKSHMHALTMPQHGHTIKRLSTGQ